MHFTLFSDLHCVHQNVNMFYFHFPPRFHASNFLFHFNSLLLPLIVKIRSTYVLLDSSSYPVSTLESRFLSLCFGGYKPTVKW